jgi:hypothetical protein
MKDSLFETVKFVKGLAPAADRWNTSPATDIVNTALYQKVTFLVHQAGGTTGRATLTVEACSDVTGTGATAVPFRYSVGGTGAGAGGDETGATTNATAAGFSTTAAAEKLYLLEVDAAELPADKPFVRLKCTEAVDDPVTGAVEILLTGARYAGQALPSAIV